MIEIQFCYTKSIEFELVQQVHAIDFCYAHNIEFEIIQKTYVIDFCYSNCVEFKLPFASFATDAPNGVMSMYLSNDKLRLYVDAYPVNIADKYSLGAFDILPLIKQDAGG